MGDATGQDSSPEWDGGEADRLRCLNDMLLNRTAEDKKRASALGRGLASFRPTSLFLPSESA